LKGGAALGAVAVILTVGVGPYLVAASDHLDAPNLGAVHVDGAGNVSFTTTGHEERDIADLYAFRGASASNTALVLTTNPAVNAGLSPASFGSDVRYTINVDRTGDAIQDLAFVVTFGPVSGGTQAYTVTRYEGLNARSLAHGTVLGTGSTSGSGTTSLRGSGKAFAGERSDPFFFDLLGFLGSVKGAGTRRLDDGQQADFFAHLDVMAIVLEVPTESLGGTTLGIWATTSFWDGTAWVQADQVGRPAINTVFNASGADKEAFNVTPPSQQPTAMSGRFHDNVVAVLEHFGRDSGGANAIANFLLPDVLTYDTTKAADGTAFNGRALADDVIDAELAVATDGHVTTDMIGPHGDYLASFPYLGAPH
jgi:hypothetical protein